jgi:hypothetical protein
MGLNKKLITTGEAAAAVVTGTDHFDIVTYTGNGSTQSITSLDFQPDFVWIKDRGALENHYLIDSVRGLNGGSVFETLYSTLTNGQANEDCS